MVHSGYHLVCMGDKLMPRRRYTRKTPKGRIFASSAGSWEHWTDAAGFLIVTRESRSTQYSIYAEWYGRKIFYGGLFNLNDALEHADLIMDSIKARKK